MKFQISNCWSALLFVLGLTTGNACSKSIPYPLDTDSVEAANEFYKDFLNVVDRVEKSQAVMLDNELDSLEAGRDANFFFNPLLLNGKPLEYADFSISSKGTLTVVEGDPKSSAATKIPFKIYLRRNGEIIEQGKSDIDREVFEIEISKVLSIAHDGDHLLIVPVRKTDWKAKRILCVIDGC